MSDMTQAADLQNMNMSMGEMKGQLREVVHTLNNLVMKVEALVKEAATNSRLPKQVEELDRRVTLLEADKNKRAGALSLGEWIIKIVPWVVGASVFAFVAKLLGLSA